MKYKIIKAFHSPRFGNCNPGDLLPLDDKIAKQFKEYGFVEEISETKPEPEAKLETKPATQPKKKTKSKR